MGIDLTLVLTFAGTDEAGMRRGSDFFAATQIRLTRDYNLWDAINKVPLHQLPFPMSWYESDGLRQRTTTPYGEELKYVLSGELAHALAESEALPDASMWNRAATEFIKGIPPDTPVVLWWS